MLLKHVKYCTFRQHLYGIYEALPSRFKKHTKNCSQKPVKRIVNGLPRNIGLEIFYLTFTNLKSHKFVSTVNGVHSFLIITFFFCKNIEAEISQNFKHVPRTYQELRVSKNVFI